MSIFGWSLPAGCDSLPGEWDDPCEICWQDDFTCTCPECPECGDIGVLACYRHPLNHMRMDRRQIRLRAAAERHQREQEESYSACETIFD